MINNFAQEEKRRCQAAAAVAQTQCKQTQSTSDTCVNNNVITSFISIVSKAFLLDVWQVVVWQAI